MFSNQDIARYYDLSESQYRLIWGLDKSRSLHYGYWDAHTKNLHEALLNINKKLSEKAGITSMDNVLDAGCGVGGSSLWLAANIGCNVTGISLSAKQINQATTTSNKERLDKLTSFEVRDYTRTGFENTSFDVVWAIESVCHAKVKLDFLREAYRLLKPGGRLILADFFKQPGLVGDDAALITRWANGWAVDDFSAIEDFTSDMKAAGFKSIDLYDATQHIVPSARRLHRAYYPGRVGAWLYNLFHPNATGTGIRNLDTARTQWVSLRKGLWRYFIVLGVK